MVGSNNRLENSKGAMTILALLLYGATYGFVSWAIDSGNLIVYALCLASLYFAALFSIRAVKQWVNGNDNRGKAKKARRT